MAIIAYISHAETHRGSERMPTIIATTAILHYTRGYSIAFRNNGKSFARHLLLLQPSHTQKENACSPPPKLITWPYFGTRRRFEIVESKIVALFWACRPPSHLILAQSTPFRSKRAILLLSVSLAANPNYGAVFGASVCDDGTFLFSPKMYF